MTKGGGGAICHVQSGPMAYGALHYYIWRNGELGRPTLDQALSSTLRSPRRFPGTPVHAKWRPVHAGGMVVHILIHIQI